MTTLLYIVLGISIGVGCTLIFLQERFIRERRLVIAASESEREKSAKLLKDLDEKWESECDAYKEEVSTLKQALKDTEGVNLEEINAEKLQLAESLSQAQQHTSDLQDEVTFLKGEIKRLEEEKQGLPADDFIVVSPPGGHLLPGAVARALMGKKDS